MVRAQNLLIGCSAAQVLQETAVAAAVMLLLVNVLPSWLSFWLCPFSSWPGGQELKKEEHSFRTQHVNVENSNTATSKTSANEGLAVENYSMQHTGLNSIGVVLLPLNDELRFHPKIKKGGKLGSHTDSSASLYSHCESVLALHINHKRKHD